MPSYLLRIVAPNQPIKNIAINRLMAIRTEPGAKYILLDRSGSQVVADLKLSQTGSTLVVEAEGKKMLYLNQFYNKGLNATFDTTGGGVSAAASQLTEVPPPSSPSPAYEPTPTSSAATASSTGEVAASSDGWGGISTGSFSLGGTMGTVLLGGGVLLGAAALAGGGKDDDPTPSSSSGNGNSNTDTTGPSISSIALSSSNTSGYLRAGDVVSATVTLNENTTVTGSPTIKLNIGGTAVDAVYSSGSGGKTLVFNYTIQANQTDDNGIAINAGSITPAFSATLKDASGNAATLTHGALADVSNLKVDALNPQGQVLSPIATTYAASNDTGAGVYRDDMSPSSIPLGNTGFSVLAWKAINSDGKYQIWLQKLDSSGQKVGTATSVTSTNSQSFIGSETLSLTALNNNGDFAISWTQAGATFAVRDILVQRFDSSLNKVGSTFTKAANSGTFISDSPPQISAFGSNGAYAVAWDGFDRTLTKVDDWANRSIWVQIFDKDGVAGSLHQLKSHNTSNGLQDNFFPTLSKLGNGALALAWSGSEVGKGNYIYVQKLTSAGALDGSPISFADTSLTRNESTSPILTPIGSSGDMIVTWTSNFENNNTETAVFVQKLSANNTKGELVTLKTNKTPSNANDSFPDVTILADGSFVVAWQGVNTSGGKSVYLQSFNADGSKKATAATELNVTGISDNTALNQNPEILALSNGGFVVTWIGRDFSLNGGENSLQVQQFNSSGSSTGFSRVTLEAPNMTTGVDGKPELLALADGRYLIHWQGTARDGSQTILSQEFNADGTLDSASYGNAINPRGGSINLQQNETGTAYLIAKHLTVDDVSDLSGIPSYWILQQAINTANQATAIQFDDLASGEYAVYFQDGHDNLSKSGQTVQVSVVETAALSSTVNGVLNKNDVITATVTLNTNATVSSTSADPMTLDLKIGDRIVQATYASNRVNANNKTEIVFNYTILDSQNDLDGISIMGDSLRGGSIKENNIETVRGFTYIADNNQFTVDNVAPEFSISSPAIIGKGSSVSANISEAGKVYLVHKDLSFTSVDQFDGFASDKKISKAAFPATNTALDTKDLTLGEYKAYASDIAGNLSAAHSQTVTINNGATVVFDLVEGVSSIHNGSRTFDASKTYTIYIRVDSDAKQLSSDGVGPKAGSTWGTWSGAQNLGADDKVLIVGNNSSAGIQDKTGKEVLGNGLNSAKSQFVWIGQANVAGFGNFAAKLKEDGQFTRQAGGGSSKLDLWDGAGNWHSLNKSYGNSRMFLNTLPAGVLSAEGLV